MGGDARMEYNKKDILITGFALFAMLFGAGNLIFPPSVGYEVGNSWVLSIIGFLITGVGFPLLAIVSASFAGGGVQEFGEKVSTGFGKLFAILLILAIGPLLALPRTGATAFEMSIGSTSLANFGAIKYIFLAIYFAISLMFSLRSNKVIDRIGKILTPILLVMLAIIIFKGVSSPLGTPKITGTTEPFKLGFFNGYQTMDTLAGIVFSGIILKSIRAGRNLNRKQEFSFMIKSSLIALVSLAVVYGGLLYIGATSNSVVPNLGTTKLLTQIVFLLLGNLGNVFLGICVAGACLTTAVGLTAMVADYFSGITKLSYEKIAVMTTVVSFVFASFGVDTIIKISAPLLVFLYPIAIVLIVLNFAKSKIKNDNIYLGGVLGAGFIGMLEMFQAIGIEHSLIEDIIKMMPLNSYGLTWVVPAIVGGVVFCFLKKEAKRVTI
jgi:LIVCS family branched-chain amino acid:cation transporter